MYLGKCSGWPNHARCDNKAEVGALCDNVRDIIALLRCRHDETCRVLLHGSPIHGNKLLNLIWSGDFFEAGLTRSTHLQLNPCSVVGRSFAAGECR